ncbi:MAG: aspartate 1-decarboxylase [Cyanobacteriota bacterium]|nr:aspartate 1-decarboxylase [Cyanobacteriota bacterium]
MYRTLLLAKIHNCTITAANLDYVGSISIDQTLLEAADLFVHEQVQVVNIANGERLFTYVISADAGSGAIELNGAAARLGMAGDRIIIMSFAQLTPDEIPSHRPKIVFVDEKNQIVEVQG